MTQSDTPGNSNFTQCNIIPAGVPWGVKLVGISHNDGNSVDTIDYEMVIKVYCHQV